MFFPLLFPLSAANGPDERLHPRCAGALHLRRHMSVDVEGERRRRMAEIALHGLDVVAGLNRRDSVTVPQIVQPCVGQADRCDDLFIIVINRVRRDMFSNLVAKDQPGILPKRSCPKSFFRLPLSMLSEHLDDCRGDHNRPPLPILRGYQTPLTRMPRNVLELFVDADRGFVKIHAVPGESTDFASAHPGEKRDKEKRFISISADRLRKGCNVVRIQRHDLLALHTRQLAEIRGIEADITDFDGLLQRPVKDAMRVFDRLG